MSNLISPEDFADGTRASICDNGSNRRSEPCDDRRERGGERGSVAKSSGISKRMRIYSWNVNGLRAVLRKGALQDFLEQEHPDILCLQEVKAKPDQVEYEFPGYQIFWNPAARPGYSGTAILFSEKLSKGIRKLKLTASVDGIDRTGDQNTLFGESPEAAVEDITWTGDGPGGGPQKSPSILGEDKVRQDPSRDLAVREGRILALDCDKFYLVNTYVPNSKPDLSRLKLRHEEWDPWLKSFLEQLEQEKPVVVCGDFNAAHKEIDIARPKTNHHSAGFTDEERQGITNYLSSGLVDTFRTLHPTEVRYTWWSHWGQARANNVGWRIDYFFISKSLSNNLKSAEIYEHYMGSDHCPISIDLEF